MRGQAAAPALRRDEPPQVAEDAVEGVVAQLGVGPGGGRVERDVQLDAAAEQPADVPVGENLAVRGNRDLLVAVLERVQEGVEVLHHERLADGAVDERARVLEEGPVVAERVEVERRLDVVLLQRLGVVPSAVDAGRLDVAHAVHVDAEIGGGGRQLGAALHDLAGVEDGVAQLSGCGPVARAVEVGAGRGDANRELPVVAGPRRPRQLPVGPQRHRAAAGRHPHRDRPPAVRQLERLFPAAGFDGQVLPQVQEPAPRADFGEPRLGPRLELDPAPQAHPAKVLEVVPLRRVEAACVARVGGRALERRRRPWRRLVQDGQHSAGHIPHATRFHRFQPSVRGR